MDSITLNKNTTGIQNITFYNYFITNYNPADACNYSFGALLKADDKEDEEEFDKSIEEEFKELEMDESFAKTLDEDFDQLDEDTDQDQEFDDDFEESPSDF